MKRPLNILHIMPQIGTGGAERQLYELIVHSNPDQMQHEVLYYSDSRDEECYKLYDRAGIKYTRVPRGKYHPLKFLRDFADQIRRRNPDVVHCWLVSGNFWGRLAAILAGGKCIVISWRNCDLWRSFGMWICERITAGRIHHLANSRACGNYIAKKLWISSARFTVIYNGLQIEKFNIPSQRKELFSHLSIPDNFKIITMVGRLMEQKNYPMLIQVAQKTKQMGLTLHYIVAGTGVLLDNLLEMARQLEVDDRVHFIGVRNDIPQILASSDIFLFTTNFEGFPNALLEAMAAKLPLVTTQFIGVDELVQDGRNGIIVPMDDADAAAAALRYYVDNPQKAKEYGKNAFRSVESAFSMGKMVEETEKFYRKKLENNT
jgi:glycosyltransferase involved in cell wall biosynthesis